MERECIRIPVLLVCWLSWQDELLQMSNWTGMRTVQKRGGMAQSVEHIVHIDGGERTERQPGGLSGLAGSEVNESTETSEVTSARSSHAD